MISRDKEDELEILSKSFGNHLKEILIGKTYLSGLNGFDKNTKLSFDQLDLLSVNELIKINIQEEKIYITN